MKVNRRGPSAALAAWVVLVALLLSCGSQGLPGDTPDARALAAAELGVNGANENIPPLVQALRRDQEIVQIQAATSLGRIGTVEAVAALREFIDADSRLVRQAVAQALRDVDPSAYPEAAEVLVEMGHKTLPKGPDKDPDLLVRAAVVTSLAVVQQPVGVEYLVDRLEKDADEGIRNAAVQTLGRLGDPRAVEVLIDVYHNDNEKNRSWAIEALGEIGDERGRKVILEALEDFDPVCRGKAAWALMQMDGEKAIPLLTERLAIEEDDMPAVVMAHALALLGRKDAV
ncbi:MAG TPA: HEAT repeat domain-containing protein, partial [Acidobacteria bacterium]|nr:HEAT repeat domain-containing protein [Acidobacteriota bacterium]